MDTTFYDLGIEEKLCEKLRAMGIDKPTSVQSKVIPLVKEGRNLMFQSETGTGKTFAYLLPLIQHLEETQNEGNKKDVRLLIASPTYELAAQIKLQVQKISDLKCALCIGGAPIARQIELLKEKPVIVIGGPVRLMELIHLKKLKAEAVETLVLDEADRLLSPELRDGTESLMERLPKHIQLIGNSATVSIYTKKTLEKVRSQATGTDEKDDKSVEFVQLPTDNVLSKNIEHWAIFAERRDKIDTLRSFICAVEPKKLIVFTERPDQVVNIANKLTYKKIECASISAKTEKQQRKSALDKFKSGKIKILITTDLTARGLDIDGITHVIQMELPQKDDFFVHRAGRTARAGKKGINIVIGDALEMQEYAKLEKRLGIKVYPKVLYKGHLKSTEEVYQ